MYKQVLDPVSHSLGLTTIFAVLPLVVLFVLLGGFRMKAQWASLIALGVSMLIAIIVYSMPVGQTPFLALIVPFVLVFMADGLSGVRATWPAALTAGTAFAALQFATSNYVSTQLTDIVAALGSAAAVVALVQIWTPTSRRPARAGHRSVRVPRSLAAPRRTSRSSDEPWVNRTRPPRHPPGARSSWPSRPT